MKTYNHAYSFCFSVSGSTTDDGMDVTAEQLRSALIHRLKHMDDDELLEAVGAPFDTFEETDND